MRKKPLPLTAMSSGLLVTDDVALGELLRHVGDLGADADLARPGAASASSRTHRRTEPAQLLNPTMEALATLLPITSRFLLDVFNPLSPDWNPISCPLACDRSEQSKNLRHVAHRQRAQSVRIELQPLIPERDALDPSIAERLHFHFAGALGCRHLEGVDPVWRSRARRGLPVPRKSQRAGRARAQIQRSNLRAGLVEDGTTTRSAGLVSVAPALACPFSRTRVEPGASTPWPISPLACMDCVASRPCDIPSIDCSACRCR